MIWLDAYLEDCEDNNTTYELDDVDNDCQCFGIEIDED